VPVPDLEPAGCLPPGIHAASLAEVRARFGAGSAARQRQGELLRQVVEAAKDYPTIKRVLLWGSFVTAKPEPNDLDYSLVVSLTHHRTQISPQHRRFFIPSAARQYYGVDKSYLVIKDYPLDVYVDRVDFVCRDRAHRACGILEISIRGEFTGEYP
jgi:uncharacterized protein DUF6932